MFLNPGNAALSIFEYAAHRAAGMDTPIDGPEAREIPAGTFTDTTTPTVGRLCPPCTPRFRPFMMNQDAVGCTRHHALPLPDTIPIMKAAAAKAASSATSKGRQKGSGEGKRWR